MASILLWLSLLALTLSAITSAQQIFFPAAIPLAVRSPHFSVWYDAHAGAQPLSSSWPSFWSGAIIGWAGRIRVDGVTYSWMGSDKIWNSTATVSNVQITPTRSIFVMQAGPMNVTVTYLSPIEPSDWVNQSIPFSYVSVEAQALDGATHDVQMYSDISSELVTGIRPSGSNGGDPVSWQSTRTSQTLYHETEPETLRQYTEVSDQAQDGQGYYAMALSTNLSWEIDTDVNCRNQFLNTGNLTNTQVAAFGPMGKPWYVFALAVDLGTIQSTSSPVTWAIGYVRDPVVPYTTPSGATEVRRPYWTTQYSDVGALIDAFVADYPAAHDRAVAFDEKIMSDAAKISPSYVDIVSLVTRQAMAAIDITVLGGSGSSGKTTDVKAFMRDIGSSTRVNPVETLFAAFPTYLYLNASLGGALLAPLLESQDNLSGQSFAAQDIGSNYPNATGTRGGASQQGVEQSGNMLIMMYAHARVSGDGSLLSSHYDTAKRWANYLVNNSLTPVNQDSADGLTNPNMTNLAIKGIIGVKAMAEISRATHHDSDAQQYDSQAAALVGSWLSLAESDDQQHLLGQYGDQSSSAMLYNIYADLLLGTNLIPQDILVKQTQYYNSLLQTDTSSLGLYIDTALPANTASSAWTLFTAATVTDDGVRNQLIQLAWNRASFNKTAGEFPDVYDDTTGAISSNRGGRAGAALGAMFAPLALTVPNTTIAADGTVSPLGSAPGGNGDSPTANGEGGGKPNIGAIVGGVVAGVAILAIAVGVGVFFWRKRRQQSSASTYHYKEDLLENPHPYQYEATYETEYAPNRYTDADADEVRQAAAATRISPADGPYTSPYPVVGSSKARERAREMEQRYPISPTATAEPITPAAASSEVISSGSEASSGGGSGVNTVSTTDLLGLRAEVENLRRVMQGIREERLDPPPLYGN